MRILLVSSSFPRGPSDSRNAGVFVRQLAVMLAEAGHDVTVLTPQETHDTEAPFKIRSFYWPGAESSLSHVSARSIKDVFRLGVLIMSGIWRGVRVAQTERPDRIVALWAVPSGLIANATRLVTRRPYYVWALGSDIWRIDDYPLGRRILRRVLRSATRRFADGYELADEVSAISGLDCEFLATSRVLPDPTIGRRERVDGIARMLCVARFHEHKGVDVLVEAVGLLSSIERESFRLTIRGEGPDESRIRKLIESHELGSCVTLEGLINAQELRDLLQTTDLAIIPSRVESIPLILSDYAQCDVPMIVTDTGDLGRLSERFDAARVVASGDARELAEAIRHFLAFGATGSSEGRSSLKRALSLRSSMDILIGDGNT